MGVKVRAIRHRVFAAALALLAAGLSAGPALSADRLTRQLDLLLSGLHEQRAFNGAVAVARGGDLAYARGFGPADLERGLTFTPDTPSDGGSLAKPVTAAAVLLLAERGEVDLDAPVMRWVAEYPHAGTTLRQLMSHSGGLPDYDAFQVLPDAGRPVTTSDLLREIGRRKLPPAFPPGSEFAYCNLCYDTLALVAERVSGATYGDFVRTNLLQALGVTHSFVRPARFADWPGARTRGYRWSAGRFELNDAFDNEGFYGGGNIYFTARDLARWGSGWSEPARGLSRATRRQALDQARVGRGATGLTLGNWYCAPDRRRCYYTGHHQGFHDFVYWDARRRIAIAFLSNNTLSAPLQMSLPRALIAIAEGRPPPIVVAPATPAAARFELPQATERYRTPDGRVFAVRAEGTRVFLDVPAGPTYRLFPAGWGALYAPGLDVFLTRTDGGLLWDSIFERFTAQPAE